MSIKKNGFFIVIDRNLIYNFQTRYQNPYFKRPKQTYLTSLNKFFINKTFDLLNEIQINFMICPFH